MKNKKSISLSITAILLILLTNCATTNEVILNTDEFSPACVMAINFNQIIGWEQTKKNKNTIRMQTPANIENLQGEMLTTSLIPIAENLVYLTLEKFEVGFFDKEAILKSKNYSAATDESFLAAQFMQTPEGYHLLSPNNKTEIQMTNEISAEYFIYVNFTINKLLKSSSEKNGKVAPSVTTKIEISNSSGKIEKQGIGYSTNKNTVPIKKGDIDSQKLMALYPETIRDSIDLAIQNLK